MQLQLRQLISELASKMSVEMTFAEIAVLFFENGIIDDPGNPYPEYPGTKRDYATRSLLAAQDLPSFGEALNGIAFHLEYGIEPGCSMRRAHFLMEKLGFTLDESGFEYNAPERLPIIPLSRTTLINVVDVPGMPQKILELTTELNDNVQRNNVNAAALIVRQILTRSIFLRMAADGKAHLLKDKEGQDVELSKAIEIVCQECKIPRQVGSRIRKAKWISDSANHSYYIDVTEDDVDTAVTALRLFLAELFGSQQVD